MPNRTENGAIQDAASSKKPQTQEDTDQVVINLKPIPSGSFQEHKTSNEPQEQILVQPVKEEAACAGSQSTEKPKPSNNVSATTIAAYKMLINYAQTT